MSSYLPNLPDYIPQIQPFTPDYNFLGNMLQLKQSRYDQGYQQLSKTYGTLLNSPMLREDNILKRDEFFKVIDQDIKKISGMDLSLQQNVNSANAVFESFYQNKDMVHDMVYTKEYQRQLQIGESYRNCINQDDCGGKYWDQGINALHYKAEEFKKAGASDALMMSPGRFTPFINIQEKATKYLKDLLGTNGAFGVQSVTMSPDGNYRVTMKNGAALMVPYQQLLLNQFSQDQNIIDMYQTQAYVNRKSYVQSKVSQGFTEDAAEDEYFRTIDRQIALEKQAIQKAQDAYNKSDAGAKVLEEKIKTEGTTGDDDLIKDFLSASASKSVAEVSVEDAQKTNSLINSIFEAGDNRETRRQRVDALMARGLMSKQILDAAAISAAMTGQVSIEEDQFALNRQQFGFDLAKMKTQHGYNMEENFQQAVLDIMKEKYKAEELLTDATKLSQIISEGIVDAGVTGTSAVVNAAAEMTNDVIGGFDRAKNNVRTEYVDRFTSSLQGKLDSEYTSDSEKRFISHTFLDLFGRAMLKEGDSWFSTKDNKKLRNGYDPATQMFYDKEGNAYNNVQDYVNVLSRTKDKTLYRAFNNILSYRGKKNSETGQYGMIEKSIYKDFFNDDNNNELLYEYDKNLDFQKKATTLFFENNANVRQHMLTNGTEEEIMATEVFFDKVGKGYNIKNKPEFVDDYIKANRYRIGEEKRSSLSKRTQRRGSNFYREPITEESLKDDALDYYELLKKRYYKVYNEGNLLGTDPIIGKVPLVKAWNVDDELGSFAGGTATRGAISLDASTTDRNSDAVLGAAEFYRNAVSPGGDAIFTFGAPSTTLEDLSNNESAKRMYKNLLDDINVGNLSGKNKGVLNVRYLGIAGSNKDYVALNIKIPDSYKKLHDEFMFLGDEVTVYMKKNAATDRFTQAFRPDPVAAALNMGPVNLNVDDAGSVKIEKLRDGRIKVTPKLLQVIDGKSVDYGYIEPVIYSAADGAENIEKTWKASLDMLRQNNIQSKNVGVDLYYNLNDVMKLQNNLMQQFGGRTQEQPLSFQEEYDRLYQKILTGMSN